MTDSLKKALARLNQHIEWSGGPCGGVAVPPSLGHEHRALVGLHNGLVALEGGLRIFGVSYDLIPDITTWNSESGWRCEYRGLADGLQFFAEDAFGDQFAFDSDRIIRFHAETGQRDPMSDSVSAWLTRILDRPNEELSLPVLRRWKHLGNDLKPNEHLCPTYPFVVGGSRDQNLHALNRNESMRFKGDFAWQIKDLPEGSRIKLVVKGK